MPTVSWYEVTSSLQPLHVAEWCGSRRAPERGSAAAGLLIQEFDCALQDDVFDGFMLRLVCVGMNGFAIFVGFELRLRFLHNLTRGHPRILNGLAARRVVLRHRKNDCASVIHGQRTPQ